MFGSLAVSLDPLLFRSRRYCSHLAVSLVQALSVYTTSLLLFSWGKLRVSVLCLHSPGSPHERLPVDGLGKSGRGLVADLLAERKYQMTWSDVIVAPLCWSRRVEEA